MSRLVGRCPCGFSNEIVAVDPESHLACVGKKRCRGCGEAKERDDFYRGGLGGIDGCCKVCRNAAAVKRQRERYLTDPAFRDARRKAKARSYWSDPELWRLKEQGRRERRRRGEPRELRGAA